MPNPYKIYQANQGPQWLRGLDQYIEPQDNTATKVKDVKATERNHGGDEKLIKQATSVAKGKK